MEWMSPRTSPRHAASLPSSAELTASEPRLVCPPVRGTPSTPEGSIFDLAQCVLVATAPPKKAEHPVGAR